MCEEISFCSIPNKFENMKLQVACLIFRFNTCGLFNFRLFISTKPARLSLNPISIFAAISKNSNLSIFNRNYIFKFSSRFHLYCHHVTIMFTSNNSHPFTNRSVVFALTKHSSHVGTCLPQERLKKLKAEELAELEGGEAEGEGNEDVAPAEKRAKRCKGKTESKGKRLGGD